MCCKSEKIKSTNQDDGYWKWRYYDCCYTVAYFHSCSPLYLTKTSFPLSPRAHKEISFSPFCANFLISTKRHLNHLSVSYRSSGARRQTGQQNKQPALFNLTNLWKTWINAQSEAIARLLNLFPLAHQPICHHIHPNDIACEEAEV